MEFRDARTIDAVTLYERRKQAILLYKSGMSYLEIAPKIGVHRNTVGQWVTAWKKGGQAALKVQSGGRPKGSGRKLYPHEEHEIRKCLIDHCPEQLKLSFSLWTRQAVQLLIQQRLGIEMTLVSVGRYLKAWGFTPQKPVRRAYERNDERVRVWLEEEYPAIAQRARHEGAEIHWGDETGLRSDDVNGRSYAPKGKTPIQQVKGTAEKVNMISTVTNRGQLRFMFYRETMTAQLFISFLKRLIRGSSKKIFLIVDNLRAHHSKIVQEWLKANSVFIEIFYLPSYSPDLNPDELLNSTLKSNLGKKPESRRKGELENNAKAIMRSIQKKPKIVQNLFLKDSVCYAS